MKYILIEKYRFKKCTKCFRTLPATKDFFWKNNKMKYKLNHYCIDCLKADFIKYRKTHKKEEKLYRLNNKEKRNKRERERRKKDVIFKLSMNTRNLIKNTFVKQKFTKQSKTYQILGCTYEEFKEYIEKQFSNWMSWNNYGKYNGCFNFGWDLDHKIPICTAKTKEDIIKLNHYTNFQPLCSKINRESKKGNSR